MCAAPITIYFWRNELLKPERPTLCCYRMCVKVLGDEKKLWEDEVYKFSRRHQLKVCSDRFRGIFLVFHGGVFLVFCFCQGWSPLNKFEASGTFSHRFSSRTRSVKISFDCSANKYATCLSFNMHPHENLHTIVETNNSDPWTFIASFPSRITVCKYKYISMYVYKVESTRRGNNSSMMDF